jgi:nucleoside-diphosphate-sugar epimerase
LRGLERFHHVSTAFVAGNQPPGQPMPEAVLERPNSFKNPYEASKFEAERAVVASGLPFTIFRPSIVLGERVSGHCDGQTVYKVAELIRLATLVARRAPAGAPHRYRVVVDPDTTRNLVTVDDVVCAMLSLAARGNLAPFYNLTNPEPAPMTDVISVIAGLLNIPKYEAVRSLEGAPLSPFEAALQRVSGVFRPYMLNSDPDFMSGVSRAWIGPVGRTCLEYLLSSYFEQRYGRAVHAASAEA